MIEVPLLKGLSADGASSYKYQVPEPGTGNVYAAFSALGGGTLEIYEAPKQSSTRPAKPVFSTTDGTPKRLYLTPGSYVEGVLTGSSGASGVSLSIMFDEVDDE